jgi:hypothetical protein
MPCEYPRADGAHRDSAPRADCNRFRLCSRTDGTRLRRPCELMACGCGSSPMVERWPGADDARVLILAAEGWFSLESAPLEDARPGWPGAPGPRRQQRPRQPRPPPRIRPRNRRNATTSRLYPYQCHIATVPAAPPPLRGRRIQGHELQRTTCVTLRQFCLGDASRGGEGCGEWGGWVLGWDQDRCGLRREGRDHVHEDPGRLRRRRA